MAISPDKQDIAITINVSEGDQFVVSKVNLAGNFLGREKNSGRWLRFRLACLQRRPGGFDHQGIQRPFRKLWLRVLARGTRTNIDKTTNRVRSDVAG